MYIYIYITSNCNIDNTLNTSTNATTVGSNDINNTRSDRLLVLFSWSYSIQSKNIDEVFTYNS